MASEDVRPTPIEGTKLLLVEGPDDLHVFRALLSHLGDMPEIEVRSYDGKDKLGPFLRALIAISGFERVEGIAVFRDADQNPAQSFQSVAGALRSASLPTPSRPLETIGAGLQVVVAIIPTDGSNGELEDVLLESVNGDPAVPCVDELIECLKARMTTLPAKLSKARLHAFLASREEPDLLAGQAAWAGYFPWDSPAFIRIIQLLRAM